MAIVPGYEYDIFVSYRQNDNRSGWVTEFAKNLTEELAATLKEPVSVYFDSNPHDGLLEIHQVGKSLESKLKCLIFIPILSQTYCDPKSFAWQNEFLAFSKFVGTDVFGKDIRLNNGNVISRILPIKIHDLDATDKATVETEIGGPLRAIEFIYREPGVNRPLTPADNKNDNQNKTDYRNQINKVANAVKELIQALQSPAAVPKRETNQQEEVPRRLKKKIMFASICLMGAAIVLFALYYLPFFNNPLRETDRSIAVIPFENMNHDPEQDYFSSGIAEDILDQLVKISDLQVKSRTSTLQYKGTTKSIPSIGKELGVANIVEGSVRRVGERVRIVVQLIDAKRDVHLWSETYDRELKDVLSLQSEIAIEIAKKLQAQLSSSEKDKLSQEPTKDVSAYDFYLKARDQINRVSFSKDQYLAVMDLVNKAIALDPSFSKAYALRAALWFQLSGTGLPQRMWEDSVFANTAKSISLDSLSSDGYIVQSRVQRFLGDLQGSHMSIEAAYRLNPKDAEVQTAYGYELLAQKDPRGADMIVRSVERSFSTRQTEYYEALAWPLALTGDYTGVEKMLKEAIKLNPHSDANYYFLGNIYRIAGQYEKSLEIGMEELRNNPKDQGAVDNIAWAYFLMEDYTKAAEYWSKYKEIEAGFDDNGQTVPFRHRLAMALLKLHENQRALELLAEDEKIQTEMLNKTRSVGTWGNKGSVYYDLAVDQALLRKDQNAIKALDSAFKYGFRIPTYYGGDPAFESIKSQPEFQKVQSRYDSWLEFQKTAFTAAINRAQAGKELQEFNK